MSESDSAATSSALNPSVANEPASNLNTGISTTEHVGRGDAAAVAGNGCFSVTSLINALPNAALYRDFSEDLIVANQAFYSLTGLSPSNLAPLAEQGDASEFITAVLSDSDEERKQLQEQAQVQQVRSVPSGDTSKSLVLSKTLVKDENDNAIGVVVFCDQSAVSSTGTGDLNKLESQVADLTRKADLGTFATGVLHNVGNVVNSVNISTTVIRKRVEKSVFPNLERINELIQEHESDFVAFIQEDKRGKRIPDYLQKLTAALSDERNTIQTELKDLLANVEHIKAIVHTQQSVAKNAKTTQEIGVEDIIHDALTISRRSLEKHKVQVTTDIAKAPTQFHSDKHKILQILINLLTNAKDALVEHQVQDPQVCVKAISENDDILLSVTDNGIGIPPEKLGNIFQHGFTTKETGHGFGLHSCANAASELSGELSVSSPGLHQGATFTLRLPIRPKISEEERSDCSDSRSAEEESVKL